MKVIKTFIKNHTLFSIYTMVFLILFNGVIITSGGKYVFNLFLFFIPLIIFYFGISSLAKGRKIKLFNSFKKIPERLPEYAYIVLAGICVFLIIGHLIHIGGSPGVKGLSIMDTKNIVELRRNVTSEASSLWNYISSFNIKAILPFTLLLLAFKKKRLFFSILLIIGAFYAFSLMQKSYILTVLIPILLYSIIVKKYLQSLVLVFTCTLVIFSLVYVSNPQMRGGVDNVDNADKITLEPVPIDKNETPYLIRVCIGLSERMIVTPGEMVSKWFETIPSQKPYLYGNGYNFYSKLMGNEFHEYSKELYPILRPQYAERGMKGSVNVASFMYEYSNFGKIGLVLSAFILALLFVIIEAIFKTNFKLKASLNLFPIFLLSSGALTTALFSGGWGLIVFLYFIFEKDFRSSYEKN